jgi:hypothetical protein
MLFDNAHLARAFLHAYQVTGNEFYKFPHARRPCPCTPGGSGNGADVGTNLIWM